MSRCADADDGHIDAVGNGDGQFLHHAFQHQREGARLRDGAGVGHDLGMFFLALAARAIAAQRIDRLRGQADMGHDRDAALAQKRDGFGHHLTAFQLHRRRAGFRHDAAGAGKGLLR